MDERIKDDIKCKTALTKKEAFLKNNSLILSNSSFNIWEGY